MLCLLVTISLNSFYRAQTYRADEFVDSYLSYGERYLKPSAHGWQRLEPRLVRALGHIETITPPPQ